jgi:hypothetical protein
MFLTNLVCGLAGSSRSLPSMLHTCNAMTPCLQQQNYKMVDGLKWGLNCSQSSGEGRKEFGPLV